jgi:hypothetical protein
VHKSENRKSQKHCSEACVTLRQLTPDNCCTKRVLMNIFQSVAASAKCCVPHTGFLDLANVHVKTAEDFKTAGGSRLHSRPDPDNPLWVAVPKAAQAYYDVVNTVCTKEGYTQGVSTRAVSHRGGACPG